MRSMFFMKSPDYGGKVAVRGSYQTLDKDTLVALEHLKESLSSERAVLAYL